MLEYLRLAPVRGDLRGEQSFQLDQRRLNDLLVRFADPVDVRARLLRARRKHELEHRLVTAGVFLATLRHVRVHREQRRPGEHQPIVRLELTVEPDVNVDDGDTLELFQLLKERLRLPNIRKKKLERVHRHGADVVVASHNLPADELHTSHLTRGLIHQNPFKPRLRSHLAAPVRGVLRHRSAEPVGLVTVEEGCLAPVRLVDEPVHGGQDDGHGELIAVDEIQRLAHGDEQLLAHPLRHEVLLHPLLHRQLILRVDVFLTSEQHRHEGDPRAQLLGPREHLIVGQDGVRHVERRG